MAKVKVLQTNFTSGVLDPKVIAREDIAFFYNGLFDAENITIMPQGGCNGRPGFQHVMEAINELEEVSLAGATITAPQGGTTANLTDGNAATYLTSTNPLNATNPFVLAHVQLTGPTEITAVDLINMKLSAGILDDEFFVQTSSDNVAWANFGTAVNLDATDRSRRRRVNAAPVTATYIRVVRIGTTSLASTVSLSGIKVWRQADDLSELRLVPFAYSTGEAYMMVATDRNLDILVGDVWKGSIAIDHTSDHLSVLNWTQQLDTLLLFHKNVRPVKIFRQGQAGDDEFDFRMVPFVNIPQYDFGAGTGGADEVQSLNDGGTIATGNKFTLLLEGNRTLTITAGATRANTASAIETALRALNNTSATGITVTDNTDGFAVTFGGDDGKQPWDDMSVSVMSGNSVWSVSKTTEGKYPGEDVMSDTRGWPRTGIFHQDRLDLGGITSLPDAFLGSCIGDVYDFNIDKDDDTKALMIRASTDQVGAIYQIVAGRHLSLFANDGEFYFTSEAIKEDSVLKLSTRCGSKEGLRVKEADGALIFNQGIRDEESDREIATSKREFIFVDTEQSYQANMISKLSSHLIRDPVDTDLRKALSTDEADIMIDVNADGSGTAYTILRSDGVNAFVPITTRAGDRLLAVGVDKKRRVYFGVERVINGVTRRFIERWNDNLYLDGGGIVTITAEEKIAVTDGQTAFTWTFTNPGSSDAIGVRIDGGRVDGYAVNLGTKTVTLTAEQAAMIAEGSVVRISSMVTQISGLDHLNGETVSTYIDGSQGPDYPVTAGILTLAEYADTEIQYGFDYTVRGKLMPLRIPNSETLAAEKVRVLALILQLHQTSGIDIRANNGNWQSVPLIKTDDEVLDRSAEELEFTGEQRISGLRGFAVGAPVEFRRPGPGKFTLLGITREVSL